MPRLEEYWERRELEERRKAERARRRKGNSTLVPTLAAAKVEKVKGHPCRVCALQGRRNERGIEAHHIVHRNRIGSSHSQVHSPDNIMPVCHQHHQDHHSTTRRIPAAALTEAERVFLEQYGGLAWSERWYPRTEG